MADCKDNKEESASDEPKPQITMKIDSPEESSDNSANVAEETEKLATEKDSDSSCSSNGMSNNTSKFHHQPSPCSNSDKRKIRPNAPHFALSRFGNSFGVNSSLASSSDKPFGLKPSLLRPSALGAVTNSSTPTKSVLKPATFHNPFVKAAEKSTEDGESAMEENSNKDLDSSKESQGDGENEKDDANDEKKEEKKEEKEKEPPKFLVLNKSPNDNPVSSSNSNSVGPASTSTPSFVFGQNLKERCAVAKDATEGSESSEKEESKEESTPSNENGSSSSELMFSNAAAVAGKSTSKPGLTLSQAAQEMDEANRANKRKYSEVALLTGEEGETNVVQINCKLFAFDKATSSYQERGRGSLRLNDKDEESRLIIRAAGTQRLVLNTKVWPGMTVERPGAKSLRLTAIDAQAEIRIFVVQANQKEIEQLHELLLHRLKRVQERQPKKLAVEH